MIQPTDKQKQEARREFNAYILEVRERVKKLAEGYSTYSGKRGAIRDVLTVIDSFVPDVALLSRDQEIREVLEGLSVLLHIDRNAPQRCWCANQPGYAHTPACLATQRLWSKLNLRLPGTEVPE